MAQNQIITVENKALFSKRKMLQQKLQKINK